MVDLCVNSSSANNNLSSKPAGMYKNNSIMTWGKLYAKYPLVSFKGHRIEKTC